jgi:hypothetical protein
MVTHPIGCLVAAPNRTVSATPAPSTAAASSQRTRNDTAARTPSSSRGERPEADGRYRGHHADPGRGAQRRRAWQLLEDVAAPVVAVHPVRRGHRHARGGGELPERQRQSGLQPPQLPLADDLVDARSPPGRTPPSTQGRTAGRGQSRGSPGTPSRSRDQAVRCAERPGWCPGPGRAAASRPVTHVTGPRKTPLFSALSWARAPERSDRECTLDRRSSSRTGGMQPHGSNEHQQGRTHREPDPRP